MRKRYTKKQYITALMACYGMDKKQAAESVKTGLNNGLYGILNAIADGYKNHCVLAD